MRVWNELNYCSPQTHTTVERCKALSFHPVKLWGGCVQVYLEDLCTALAPARRGEMGYWRIWSSTWLFNQPRTTKLEITHRVKSCTSSFHSKKQASTAEQQEQKGYSTFLVWVPELLERVYPFTVAIKINWISTFCTNPENSQSITPLSCACFLSWQRFCTTLKTGSGIPRTALEQHF